jgi:hypothetical protein
MLTPVGIPASIQVKDLIGEKGMPLMLRRYGLMLLLSSLFSPTTLSYFEISSAPVVRAVIEKVESVPPKEPSTNLSTETVKVGSSSTRVAGKRRVNKRGRPNQIQQLIDKWQEGAGRFSVSISSDQVKVALKK